ncbi:maker94 [Drosophila busckii]|uniref:Elongation of very long chain fatty acids protein n=1 Tax=Drosophila busckii TaxID=30019 RepID=A0A0M4EWC1_DROBS|nr:elongation of very long chain fatty acids protein F [Drosophila busckii]ALC42070.1 maker94 [Drosophila busckii]
MLSIVVELAHRPYADPVAQQLPFMGSAWSVGLVLASYMCFVLSYGQRFMLQRQAYNLKNILIAYNGFQVIYNAILFAAGFYMLCIARWYDFRCMETSALDDPRKHYERIVCYAYYINKIIDLLDTVFFVLRKSYKQITLLHVYHHALMVLSIYLIVRYYGFGAQFLVMGVLNTFVHSIMYCYYLVAALRPASKGNLWWKKYITKAQLLQFVIIFTQCMWILKYNPTCKFPLVLQYFLALQAITFIILFTQFYFNAYIRPKKIKQT